MKTRILYFALAAAALFSLGACNQKEDGPSGDLVPLKIDASIGGYATKALDTSFEEGDLIGLFASAPLNLVNEKLTWSGGALVPGQTLYWPLGSQDAADFRAYYPYSQELKALEGKIPFQVELDQSQYANYTASDLMFAAARASAKDEKVNLVFDHKLSKIAVKVENNTGEAIREVLFAVQATTAVVDAANGEVSEAVASENVDVMHAYVSGDSFYAIVPPQKTPVQVAISTVGGKTFTFEAKEVEFLSGKQSRGTVTLNSVPEGDKVEFSLAIVPWDEGGNIRFTDSEIGERSGYDVYLINTRERIHMTETNPGEFFYNFPNYNGEQFYVLNESNNYIYGCTLKMPQDVGEWPCVNGGYFQLDGYTGDLNIWFYPDEGILKYDPVYPEWKELGECEIVRGMFSNYYGFIPEVTKAKVSEDARHPGMYIVYNPFEEKGVQNEYIDFYNEIVIDARDPEKVYMQPVQWLYDHNAGKSFTLFSDVVENGEDGEPYGENNYGTLKDGVIRLGYLTARYDDGSETVFNADKAFQLVLPGYKREPVLGFKKEFIGSSVDASGIINANYIIMPYADITSLRYAVYAGRLSHQEANGEIKDIFAAGGGTPLDFTPGEAFELSIPLAKPGAYTLYLYAESDRLPSYKSFSWGCDLIVPEGYEQPSPDLTVSAAAPHAVFPESVATVHVDFTTGDYVYIKAVPKKMAEEAGLTEDDYYYYATNSNTDLKSGQRSFFSGRTGTDFAILGLEPQTEYLVIVAARDYFDREEWASTTVTTGAEPTEWEDAGMVTLVDSTFMTTGYVAEVPLKKISSTGRYRAVQPYAKFWDDKYPELAQTDPDNFANTYIGYSTDFDFYFVEDKGISYIYYNLYRTGRCYPGYVNFEDETGFLDFFHYDIAEKHPSTHAYVRNNVAVSNGVYNLAPYVKLHNTTSFYNWLEMRDGLTLIMPDTYASAPAKISNCVEKLEEGPLGGSIIADRKVTPFKRTPLKTGKATVKTLK